jgi:hypothetical protein
LIIAPGTLPASSGRAAGSFGPEGYLKKGIRTPASNDELFIVMLDRRDIQTLMYCVRLTEISGQWQSGYPVRTPHDLECKLAELLRELEQRSASSTRAAA